VLFAVGALLALNIAKITTLLQHRGATSAGAANISGA